jgi:hypothetical protein
MMTPDPVATPVANPLELTVTTVASAEDQVADEVTFAVVPFAYVAVATNCWVPPSTRFTVLGPTARAVTAKEVTVKVAEPLIPSYDAEIAGAPAETAVASPELFTVASVEAELLQVADEVTLAVVPSL